MQTSTKWSVYLSSNSPDLVTLLSRVGIQSHWYSLQQIPVIAVLAIQDIPFTTFAKQLS